MCCKYNIRIDHNYYKITKMTIIKGKTLQMSRLVFCGIKTIDVKYVQVFLFLILYSFVQMRRHLI